MTPRGVEDPLEMLEMVRLLAEVGFRDLCSDANRVRLAIARRLSRDGVEARALKMLWEYARVSDQAGTPERLFAYWLGSPARTHAKMAEMAHKNTWVGRMADRIEKSESWGDGIVLDINRERRAGS